MRNHAIVFAVLTAVALAPGCRHWPLRARAVRDCPGELVSTASLGGDFLLRQRVRIASRDSVWSFQLIAQKRGNELLLIALDPLGVKLFTLTQQGTTTAVDAMPPPLLEVPPENLLRDLHRIRFLALEPSADDGTRRGAVGDLEIVETRAAGRLVSRSIRHAGAPHRPDSEIVFAAASGTRPERATVSNFGCGTRTEFDTLSVEEIR